MFQLKSLSNNCQHSGSFVIGCDQEAVKERCCPFGRETALYAQVTPILAELREGNLVGNLDALTASASLAAADIHQLQNDVSTSSERVR